MNNSVKEVVDYFNEMSSAYKTEGITLMEMIFYIGEIKGNKNGNIYGKEFVAVMDKLINTDLSVKEVGEQVSKETGKDLTFFRVQDIISKLQRCVRNPRLYNGRISIDDIKNTRHEEPVEQTVAELMAQLTEEEIMKALKRAVRESNNKKALENNEEVSKPTQKVELDDLIHVLNLPTQLYFPLMHARIITVGQLVNMTKKEIWEVKFIKGHKLNKLENILEAHGLKLREE